MLFYYLTGLNLKIMNQENAVGYIVAYVLCFLVAIFITRAIFSVPKFLKLQKAQLQVLTEIAVQQGVKAEVLRKIYSNNELQDDIINTTNT